MIIGGLKTLVGKILNHSTFTHTDLGSIFVANIVRSTFTQYASPFIPDITGVIDGGVVLLIDPRLLTWFIYSCCILTDIPSSAGASWVWISFPKWSSSYYLILKVMISWIAICILEISGCVPGSIELTQLLIFLELPWGFGPNSLKMLQVSSLQMRFSLNLMTDCWPYRIYDQAF